MSINLSLVEGIIPLPSTAPSNYLYVQRGRIFLRFPTPWDARIRKSPRSESRCSAALLQRHTEGVSNSDPSMFSNGNDQTPSPYHDTEEGSYGPRRPGVCTWRGIHSFLAHGCEFGVSKLANISILLHALGAGLVLRYRLIRESRLLVSGALGIAYDLSSESLQ
jgi:hypothetical protein